MIRYTVLTKFTKTFTINTTRFYINRQKITISFRKALHYYLSHCDGISRGRL